MTNERTRSDLYAQVLRILVSHHGYGSSDLYDVWGAVDQIVEEYGLIDIESYHYLTGRELLTEDEFWLIMRAHEKYPQR